MKKKILSILFVLVLALLLAAPAMADTTRTIPDTQQYPNLVDDADLLTASEYRELLALLDEISEKHQCTVAVVTVKSMDGQSAQAFADDWYDYNGYGMGPGDDGVLLVMSIGDRKWATTDYGKATKMMMGHYDALSASFRPELSKGNYFQAFKNFANGCDKLLSGKTLRVFSIDRALSILPYCLVIGLIIAFVILSILKGQVKNVHLKGEASDYTRPGSLHIRDGYEHFLHRSVTKTAKPKDSGSGTHSSSSGRSHGGSSGSF